MQDLRHGFARINTDTAKTFLDRVGIRGEFAGSFNLLSARGTVAVGILRLRDCSASRSSHSGLDDSWKGLSGSNGLFRIEGIADRLFKSSPKFFLRGIPVPGRAGR
jgi:hypothetical protein